MPVTGTPIHRRRRFSFQPTAKAVWLEYPRRDQDGDEVVEQSRDVPPQPRLAVDDFSPAAHVFLGLLRRACESRVGMPKRSQARWRLAKSAGAALKSRRLSRAWSFLRSSLTPEPHSQTPWATCQPLAVAYRTNLSFREASAALFSEEDSRTYRATRIDSAGLGASNSPTCWRTHWVRDEDPAGLRFDARRFPGVHPTAQCPGIYA
jgi:hypothetical protein